MPRLLQKLVNKWVNVNRDHIVFSEDNSGHGRNHASTNASFYQKDNSDRSCLLSRPNKSDNKNVNNKNDDSHTVHTVVTVCTSTNSLSSDVKSKSSVDVCRLNFNNWANHAVQNSSNEHCKRGAQHSSKSTTRIRTDGIGLLKKRSHVYAECVHAHCGMDGTPMLDPRFWDIQHPLSTSTSRSVSPVTSKRDNSSPFSCSSEECNHKLNIENITILHRIHKPGSFGAAYHGKYRSSIEAYLDDNHPGSSCTETPVSLRVLTNEYASCVQDEKWLSEIDTLKSLSRHPNLMTLYGWSHFSANDCKREGSDSICLVSQSLFLENCRIASLSSWLLCDASDKSDKNLYDGFFWNILDGISCGLAHLHSHNILHGNLHPDNIMLQIQSTCVMPTKNTIRDSSTNRMKVKLSDFELWRMANATSHEVKLNNQDQVPTITQKLQRCNRFVAPEMLRAHIGIEIVTDVKSDMYSFGMLAWYIITHQLPFMNVPNQHQFLAMMIRDSKSLDSLNICKKSYAIRPPFPPNIPKQLQKFIELCWNDSVDDRLSSSEVHNSRLKDLEKTYLSREEREWVNDLQGHPAYDKDISSKPNNHNGGRILNMHHTRNVVEAEEESDHDGMEEKYAITERKMSELSFQDENVDQDTSNAAKEFCKRSIELDVSIMTKSQRKALLRMKRPKLAFPSFRGVLSKEKSKSPTNSKCSLSEGCTDEPKDRDSRTSLSAPQILPGNKINDIILDTSMPQTTDVMPLTRPFFLGPSYVLMQEQDQCDAACEGDNDSECVKGELIGESNSVQMMHYNHYDPRDADVCLPSPVFQGGVSHAESLDSDNESDIGFKIVDAKTSDVVRCFPSDASDANNKTANSEGNNLPRKKNHIFPPENADTIFRRLAKDIISEKDKKINPEERLRIDALEVLSAQLPFGKNRMRFNQHVEKTN